MKSNCQKLLSAFVAAHAIGLLDASGSETGLLAEYLGGQSASVEFKVSSTDQHPVVSLLHPVPPLTDPLLRGTYEWSSDLVDWRGNGEGYNGVLFRMDTAVDAESGLLRATPRFENGVMPDPAFFRLAVERFAPDRLPASYLAVVGHSVANQQGAVFQGTPPQHRINVNGYVCHALQRLGSPLELVRNLSSQDLDFATSGFTIELVRQLHFPQLNASANEKDKTILLLDFIGNNIGADQSATQIIGKFDDALEALIAAGWDARRIVVISVRPRLYGDGEEARLIVRRQVNAHVLSRPSGIVVCDFSEMGDDGHGFAKPELVDTVRPGHPLAPFGSELGRVLARTLKTNFSMVADAYAVPSEILNQSPPGAYDFTGNDETAVPFKALPGSTIGEGWRFLASPDCVFSSKMIEDPSTAGQKLLEIEIESQGDNPLFLYPATPRTDFPVGTRIEAVAEVWPVTAQLGRLNLAIIFPNGGSNEAASDILYTGDFGWKPGQLLYTFGRHVLRTPHVLIPEQGLESTYPRLAIRGSGILRVGRMALRRLEP